MLKIESIINNLNDFYNLENKRVIHVGAGGGILTGYSKNAKVIVAIDNDPSIEKALASKIEKENLSDKFKIRILDFLDYTEKADITFFEFCLHEMDNPFDAIKHAKEISESILIIDHALNSEWSWYTLETEKLKKSWSAINQFEFKLEKTFEEIQSFDSYDELNKKLSVLGSEALERIKVFEGIEEIKIKMPYVVCLI
jgi:predicted RNA methylase